MLCLVTLVKRIVILDETAIAWKKRMKSSINSFSSGVFLDISTHLDLLGYGQLGVDMLAFGTCSSSRFPLLDNLLILKLRHCPGSTLGYTRAKCHWQNIPLQTSRAADIPHHRVFCAGSTVFRKFSSHSPKCNPWSKLIRAQSPNWLFRCPNWLTFQKNAPSVGWMSRWKRWGWLGFYTTCPRT